MPTNPNSHADCRRRDIHPPVTHVGDDEEQKSLLPQLGRLSLDPRSLARGAEQELQSFSFLRRHLFRPARTITVNDIRLQNTRIFIGSEAALERLLPDIPLRSLLHPRPLLDVDGGKPFGHQGQALNPLGQRVSIAVIDYALGEGPRRRRRALRFIVVGGGGAGRRACHPGRACPQHQHFSTAQQRSKLARKKEASSGGQDYDHLRIISRRIAHSAKIRLQCTPPTGRKVL
jgi:hypothetical protein